MTYLINEIFYSIQGEGHWSGRPAVFCRFSRCNLACDWCDTDFAHADRMMLDDILEQVCTLWPTGMPSDEAMVILTGGEPALQVRKPLIDALHEAGFYIAIETNGTMPLTCHIDWVCVSPKAGAPLVRTRGDELKLVYPQDGIDPTQFEHLDFDHFWLSPMDGPHLAENTETALEYVLAHPRWRLNIQTHKVIGVR